MEWQEQHLQHLVIDLSEGYVSVEPQNNDLSLDDFLLLLQSLNVPPSAEKRILYCNTNFAEQCNLEFSVATIRLMSEAGLSFALSCYENEALTV